MSQSLPFPARIDMVAISATANIRRHYRISYARDLFDHVVVDLHWGRIGTRGQSKSVSFADNSTAVEFIGQVLRRRATAEIRLSRANEDVRLIDTTYVRLLS